jgi:hypothetical protein
MSLSFLSFRPLRRLKVILMPSYETIKTGHGIHTSKRCGCVMLLPGKRNSKAHDPTLKVSHDPLPLLHDAITVPLVHREHCPLKIHASRLSILSHIRRV